MNEMIYGAAYYCLIMLGFGVIYAGGGWIKIIIEEHKNLGGKSKMKSEKIITIIIIAFMVVIALVGLIWGARAVARQQSEKAEKQAQTEIIERACYELDEPSEGAEIELLMITDIPWSAYRNYCYVLTCNGRRYLVGVLRNGKDIHYVDVEEDITDRDDYGTHTVRG